MKLIYTYNDLSEMVKIINEAVKIMFKYLKWDIIFKNVIPVGYLILSFQVLLSTAFSNL